MRRVPDQGLGRPVAAAERYLAPLCERFGIPRQTFEGLQLVAHGRHHVAIRANASQTPTLPLGSLDAVGLLFVRTQMARPKLTTAAAQRFAPAATRNIVLLQRHRALLYVQRELFELGTNETATLTGHGPVLVGCCELGETLWLGTGLCRQQGARMWLESYYPRQTTPLR